MQFHWKVVSGKCYMKMASSSKNYHAYEEAFHTYYEELCRYALHIVGNRESAEELVDDVFLNLWKHFDDLNQINHLRPYLYRAVKNSSLNELKSSSHDANSHVVEISSPEGMEFLDSIFCEPEHPLGELLIKELDEEMRKAIDNLPKECRTVYLLSRDRNFTYKEIADLLGISVNTVKYHLKNALSILSRDFSKYSVELFFAFLLKNIDF